MFRVDTTTAVATLPPPKPAGTPGYFTEGSQQSGLLATVPGVDFFNALQEEVVAPILAAGLTLSKSDNTQLLAAIKAISEPTGSMKMYAGAAAPTHWLLCNGAAISRTTYAALFTAIGTTWGAGDGSTTFNLPDLRGRTPIGAGQGSGLTNRALAATGGEENHTLTIAEMPAHDHSDGTRSVWAAGTAKAYVAGPNTMPEDNAYEPLASEGGGGAHNTMQPFAAVNFIIKT
ncbi:MAG TPA: tail fiber protein [Acidiferrobacterales bacterium]|nr:tail fiber protein [Acidiferrobacterales bacterium]